VSYGRSGAIAGTRTIVTIVEVTVGGAAGLIQLPVSDHVLWTKRAFVDADSKALGVGSFRVAGFDLDVVVSFLRDCWRPGDQARCRVNGHAVGIGKQCISWFRVARGFYIVGVESSNGCVRHWGGDDDGGECSSLAIPSSSQALVVVLPNVIRGQRPIVQSHFVRDSLEVVAMRAI